MARLLLGDLELDLTRVLLYTTRPQRPLEKNFEEYIFVSQEQLDALMKQYLVIERRQFDTVEGPWIYATLQTEDFLAGGDRLIIASPESLLAYKREYGDAVIPIYLETSDKDRLIRAVEREARHSKPNYLEVFRRYTADEQDFSEERIASLGIQYRVDTTGGIETSFSNIRQIVLSERRSPHPL
jgi:guanylate kinase